MGHKVFYRADISLVFLSNSSTSLYTPLNATDFFPVALQSFRTLAAPHRRFLELFYTYGRTPWTSDQPVARPLPTQDNTTQKDADKHPCLQRDSNPRSQQLTGQDPRLRPHGHCDRLNAIDIIDKN
jgi:hypothetical protein